MPVSKSLAKVQKNLKSGGKKPTIHPKGRKFQQLARASLRENKIAAKKKAHNERRSQELARIKFIQDVINIDSLKEKPTFTHEESAVFIQQFISRDDEELDSLRSKRKENRPPAKKQLLLQQKKDSEMQEFENGFLCPDLTDEKNVKFLRKWNNSFGALSTLKLVRINRSGEQVIGGNTNLSPTNGDVDME
ncbi:hypothetical protein HG535_0A06290 [Zygotorulaspora mrakii]|uniref:Translation machinery-associated protein 16 n=1 Tax=Zygotorulaspora mrakii TaxID=42260 RepID=A0A7H9AX33_ZYGMR|nr:uncharacterized protein HG535_0A06290 [Zygotorulaspora mrakii]QLG70687.1 hypothetical protein HG535_0A06290 [Zygotorulaspora mrakii]